MTHAAGPTNPPERILQAATHLFAEVGYSGASTRDIARLAAVNDATVYRHFSSKKALFAAVLESELKKLNVRHDLLVHVAKAEDVRPVLSVIFNSLMTALAEEPRLLRLLQFSVLEFGSDLQPLYHTYLGALLDGAATYLESWRELAELHWKDPRSMVVAFAVTVVALETLYPLFGSEQISPRSSQENVAKCVDLWCTLLVDGREAHHAIGDPHSADPDILTCDNTGSQQ